MPRPIFTVVAALFAVMLVLLGTASCGRGDAPQPVVPPPPPATQTCPDGSVILASDACPPQPVVLPPPMANGGDYESAPPPPPPPPGRYYRDCLSCDRPGSDDYAGSDDESYAIGDLGEGPNFAAPARNRLFRGKAAFIKPGDMEVENWHALEFYVGPTKAAIEEEAEGRELTKMQSIWLAPTMRVTLLPDPAFKVMAQSHAVQDLGFDRTANWKWKVMPLTDGRHRLQAHVEILELGPGGKPLTKPDGSLVTKDEFDRFVDIDVEVGTWRGFLNAIRNASDLGGALNTLFRSWEKTAIALTALITALGGVVMAVRKLRKAPAGGGRRRGGARRRRIE